MQRVKGLPMTGAADDNDGGDDDMDLDDKADADAEPAAEYASAKSLEYDASHRSRVMRTFLDTALLKLAQHERTTRGKVACGTFDTILDADERRESANSQVLLRMSNKLELAHAQLDFEDLPAGDLLQATLYQAAARPPFR